MLLRGTRLPALQAAVLNASMGHALDFDDTLDTGGSIHPDVSVLASVLAAADRLGGVSGRDVLLAVALGLDVSCRIAPGRHRLGAWQGRDRGGGRSEGSRGAGAGGPDRRVARDGRPRRSLSITVRRTNGRSVTVEAIDPIGSPEKPLSDAQFGAKFRDCARNVVRPVSDANVDAAIAVLETRSDARELLSPFAG